MSELINQIKAIDSNSNQNEKIKKYNELIDKLLKGKQVIDAKRLFEHCKLI
jgi:hypothetical protein